MSAGLELLRQALRERGYVEGKNLEIVHRYVQGNTDRMPSLVAELLEHKVDVLIVTSPTAIRAAQKATRTLPIVMITNQDPVAIGLVESLAQSRRQSDRSCYSHPRSKRKAARTPKGSRAKDISRVGVIWASPTSLGAANALQIL